MNISYRTRLLLRRIFSVTATVLAITLVVIVCAVVWLQRYVVYTDEGAKLVFDQAKDLPDPQLPQPQTPPEATIHFSDKPFREGLQQLSGYYIAPEDLMKDPEAVRTRLEKLPSGTPVLLDVKGYRGYFYYSTQVGRTTSGSYDMSKMDDLIRWLDGSDLYVIARLSSLRDFDLAHNDNSCGLAKTNGALYSDKGRYGLGYWLDPTKDRVITYLTDVLLELRQLGFDEVVLDNFRYPNADNLAFKGDRNAALASAAGKLIAACANENFTISFSGTDSGFVLPDSRCRLYLENIAPEEAQNAWAEANVTEKRLHLVFLAPDGDRRYQIENGLLLPLP
jgi:hypothetical protein